MVLLATRIAAKGRIGPMSTDPQRICPSCGNELSGAMEFCPVCTYWTIRFAHFAQMDDSLSSIVDLGHTTDSPVKSRCSNTKLPLL